MMVGLLFTLTGVIARIVLDVVLALDSLNLRNPGLKFLMYVAFRSLIYY
jgi:hypothetical protein